MKRIYGNSSGFTIVELMISTAIFAMVLLLCSFAIVHVGRMYYKGVLIGRTQDTSRRVIQDISRSVQFGPGSNADPDSFVRFASVGGVNAYCVGAIRYNFITGQSLGTAAGQSPHILWKDRMNDDVCQPVAFAAGMEELLGENMRLPLFSITEVNNLWNVSIRVAYGDTVDLFVDNTYAECKGSSAGGQFCAISELNTSVVKRL